MPTISPTFPIEEVGRPGVEYMLDIKYIQVVQLDLGPRIEYGGTYRVVIELTSSAMMPGETVFMATSRMVADIDRKRADALAQWLTAHSGTLAMAHNELDNYATYRRRTDMNTGAAPGQQAATAQIDVALEQVILLARECGKSEEFASDIAGPLKLLFRLMIRDALAEQGRDSLHRFTNTKLGEPYRSKPLVAGIVKDGKTLGGLPVETNLRPGETPFGYVVGYLSAPALACLEDVVSHASDIREAITVKRAAAREADREAPPIDAVYPNDPGNEESYWIKQEQDHVRLVQQALDALEIHAKVSGK